MSWRSVSRSTASCRCSPSAARDGETRFYPLVENVHEDGILRDLARAGRRRAAGARPRSTRRACSTSSATSACSRSSSSTSAAALLANEFAPRVHNTGHWTIEGAATSQFENHLRAILGLPLGSTESRPSAMVNLIGTVPPPEDVLGIPGAHLHLYGKEPRPGRKLGHVTLVEPTARASRAASAALVLSADGAADAAAARGADAPAPLRLERVLLQAGERHRPADREGEGDDVTS